MGVFDIDALVAAKSDRNAVIELCIQATEEFFEAAKKIGTTPSALNARLVNLGTSFISKQNVTKTERDPRWGDLQEFVEYYAIIHHSKYSSILDRVCGAAVALKDGTLYFDGKKTSATEIGEIIADVCGYDMDIVEQLFKSALLGEPWSMAYAREQSEKNKEPKISVIGNENTVGGQGCDHVKGGVMMSMQLNGNGNIFAGRDINIGSNTDNSIMEKIPKELQEEFKTIARQLRQAEIPREKKESYIARFTNSLIAAGASAIIDKVVKYLFALL